jgi:hypothetical protein
MKLTTTIAGALLCLALCAPVASAGPDGYQPQLREESATDVVSRYLRRNTPEVLQAQGGGTAARHPDSLRSGLPVAAPASTTASSGERFGWQAFGSGIAGGLALALLALAAVHLGKERRRLAHR